MEQKFDFEVLVKLKQKKRRKLWKRILGTMMCLVVFTTTYMLILPAITKETDTFCGVEEHIHEEACYEKTLQCLHHVHDDNCYESYSNLICTEPTDDGHIHSEECWQQLAIDYSVGVTTFDYQRDFGLDHKTVKALEKQGLLTVVGQYQFDGWYGKCHAPLYDIFQFADMSGDQMQELISQLPERR